MAFSVTIVTSALLSYHLNSHDLTGFLLPIALMANYLSKGSREIAGGRLLKLSLADLIIPFLHLWLMGNGIYGAMGAVNLLFLAGLRNEIAPFGRSGMCPAKEWVSAQGKLPGGSVVDSSSPT